MEDDSKLLTAYADGSEDAFTELVQRHGGLVQGVARRIAGESHADEVTQAVFLLLARKAKSLQRQQNVAGWLYKTARYVALEAVRRQRRDLKLHEQISSMQTDTPQNDSSWKQLAPVLDSALHRLRDTDRQAVILRFLQGRTFAEVAAATNSTEAATKMRVSRALEKLRANLVREGVTISATALVTNLVTHGAPAASPAIAATVLSQTINPALPALAKITLKMLLMKKFKMAAAVATALLLTTAITYPILRPTPKVSNFSPMSGEWTGYMETKSSAGKYKSEVRLIVKTSEDGRHCDIEMRIGDPAQNIQIYRFSHEVDPTGRQIATIDDPRVNLLNGSGKVTSARAGSEWRAAVRTEHRNGFSECQWRVQGDQLTIGRHDRIGSFFNRADQYSNLELTRVPSRS